MRTPVLATALAAAFALPALAADVRGVTDKEIVIGTASDLSGVAVEFGLDSVNAIRLAFDEKNAQGGIHGRTIRYVVEDNQYSVPRQVQAVNKLINLDGAFALLADVGVPMNNATLPLQIDKQVPNVFPVATSRSMSAPLNKYKFGLVSTNYDQIRAGLKYFVEQKGHKSICVQAQDTDFGREITDGVHDQLAAMPGRATLAAEALNKPTDTEFNAAVARLHAANCDLVVLGGIARDTLQFVGAVRKAGWNVDMFGSASIYLPSVAEAAGGTTEGIYAVSSVLAVSADDPRPDVRKFVEAYRSRYGRPPEFAAQFGYAAAQLLMVGLDRAGRELTVDRFVEGLESIHDYPPIVGMPRLSFSASRHNGSNESFLSRLQDHRWVPLLDRNPIGY